MDRPPALPEIDARSARLYAIVARVARRAVVFRRGPSGQMRLILWHLASDIFEPGQWFKGRIYERRCDLTPNGERLVTFAATYRKPLFSWTAISRPPYLTALALWPGAKSIQTESISLQVSCLSVISSENRFPLFGITL